MLSPELHEFAKCSILCWLATVNKAGQPNVSPKEVFALVDDVHLVIANIASPTSVRNLQKNHQVCVSFIDIFIQKGFKIFGTARSVQPEEFEFQTWSAPLQAQAGLRFPLRSVIVVKATAVETILAPSYRLYPTETTEQSQVESALRAYNVRAKQGDA